MKREYDIRWRNNAFFLLWPGAFWKQAAPTWQDEHVEISNSWKTVFCDYLLLYQISDNLNSLEWFSGQHSSDVHLESGVRFCLEADFFSFLRRGWACEYSASVRVCLWTWRRFRGVTFCRVEKNRSSQHKCAILSDDRQTLIFEMFKALILFFCPLEMRKKDTSCVRVCERVWIWVHARECECEWV